MRGANLVDHFTDVKSKWLFHKQMILAWTRIAKSGDGEVPGT
jgi:hypothetical protein